MNILTLQGHIYLHLVKDNQIWISGNQLYFLLSSAGMLKPWLNLCNSMDCSPSGSSVQGILQARMLEWVAISFSRKSSQPRDQTCVSCIADVFFNHGASREALVVVSSLKKRMQLNKIPNGISTLPIFFSLHNHECWTKGTYLLHFNSHLPESLCLF